jgi:hypothetical protein
METRKPYLIDVSNQEWAFVAPYLTLLAEEAPQRCLPMREPVQWPALRRPHWAAVTADAARPAAAGSSQSVGYEPWSRSVPPHHWNRTKVPVEARASLHAALSPWTPQSTEHRF